MQTPKYVDQELSMWTLPGLYPQATYCASVSDLSTASSDTRSTCGTHSSQSPCSNEKFHDQRSRDPCKLSDVLAILDHEHEDCIFIVRKISKLGYRAYESIRSHFSAFGTVTRVLLLPSRGKGDTRSRPASMGFVVMNTPYECMSALSSLTHRVSNIDIQIEKFVRNTKVHVDDGSSMISTYLPAGYMVSRSSSDSSSPVTPQPVVSLETIENLAQMLLLTIST
jgi:hypothetical protein